MLKRPTIGLLLNFDDLGNLRWLLAFFLGIIIIIIYIISFSCFVFIFVFKIHPQGLNSLSLNSSWVISQTSYPPTPLWVFLLLPHPGLSLALMIISGAVSPVRL